MLPEAGAPKAAVGVLERFGRRGVPPHHQIGVGPQCAHVIRTADRDVLGGQLLEQRSNLIREARPIAIAYRSLDPGTVDQPVYRMTVLSSRAFFPSTMTSLSRLGERCAGLGSSCTGGTNAGRDAEPVVRGAAHGEAGNRRDGPPDAGDPVDMADRVLRQAAAPSRDQSIYGSLCDARQERAGHCEPARPARRRTLQVARFADAPDRRA